MLRRTFLKAAACTAWLNTVSHSVNAAKHVNFRIATGGTGGTYYPLGGMLAQLISSSAAAPGMSVSATAETGNASVANAKLLGDGQIESAFVAADILDAAFKGVNQFEGNAQTTLRAIGALYPEVVQLIVRADSGIERFEDLKGKSVSSGLPNTGQWQLLGNLLSAHGLSRDDITEDPSSFSHSVDKFKDGSLDAAIITAGSPTSSVINLAKHYNVRVLPLQGPSITHLQNTQPYYTTSKISAGTYYGQNTDIETLAIRAIWATHENVPEDIIYAVTEALYDNTHLLGQVHPKGKEISLEKSLECVSIPLHSGAEKYYANKVMQ